jgi:acetyltransferase-like isoleucine patch superfamily enzyme
MYDNVLVLGDVKVGQNTWIGPGCSVFRDKSGRSWL